MTATPRSVLYFCTVPRLLIFLLAALLSVASRGGESAYLATLISDQCFVAGTPVKTFTGHLPIETIRTGDLVWSRCPETGAQGWQPVTALRTSHPRELWHLTYQITGPPARGAEIVCSGEHPFWIVEDAAFVPARRLRPGCNFLSAAGASLAFTAARIETAPPGSTFTTYNLEVARWHTYFAGESLTTGAGS